jgi:type VI secretion system protein ImpA
MRPDDLVKPISADAPCGEDLLEADDPEFVDYYFNVEDRLPTSYFNLARGTLFDARSIDQKAESGQIDALLKRSRDLRLLGIEAKFQILSGRFKGFVDAVMGMAALLETYPDDVHPTNANDRRNAIEELNALATIVAPLEYVPLFNDRRYGDVVFRPYATGTGKIQVRDGEEPGDSNGVSGAIGSSENSKAVDQLHAQLTGLRAALKSMITLGQARPEPFTPRLDRLDEKLRDIHDMVLAARGDLGAAAVPAATDDLTDAAAPTDPGHTAAGATFTVTMAVGDVADHRAAYRLLQSIETYFVAKEPSSLAVVLVTQARLLIGRPLVEALDALLETSAYTASITFGTDTGFAIPMTRMRELSGQANMTSPDEYAQIGEDELPAPEILSRDHAGMVLKQIEEFFRVREPASPIPILLFKARNMLTKDFHALVRELIPPSP